MELQPLKVNFYPKLRTKGSTDHTLYMRLILSGKRTDVSLDYTLKKESWDPKERALSKKCPDRSHVLNLTNKYNVSIR